MTAPHHFFSKYATHRIASGVDPVAAVVEAVHHQFAANVPVHDVVGLPHGDHHGAPDSPPEVFADLLQHALESGLSPRDAVHKAVVEFDDIHTKHAPAQ